MKKENFEKWKTTGVITWAIIGLVAVFLGLLYLIGLVRPIFYLFVLTLTIVYVLRPLVNFF
ncbi:MAG: hypothetical protein Q8M92_07340, partial [Candidatus Subteraquimicrobiales bacterium]|nr:hypothetical protein [Candidatus Subteraquimicrobiales bacterium]